MKVSLIYTHTFMSLMPSLLWKCFPTSHPNHTAWGRTNKHETKKVFYNFQNPKFTNICGYSHCPSVLTDLSFLDRVRCGLLQQLDGLVVIQSAVTSNHVPEELDAVQLPVRVLWSGVIYKADLSTGRDRTSLETEQLRFAGMQLLFVWSVWCGAYFVLDIVKRFDMFPVEPLGGEGSHTVEVLILIPVLPADGVRWAA